MRSNAIGAEELDIEIEIETVVTNVVWGDASGANPIFYFLRK